MAMWLVNTTERADGDYFLSKGRVCCTQAHLSESILSFNDSKDLINFYQKRADTDETLASKYCKESRTFCYDMAKDDIVILCDAKSNQLHVGRIRSDYSFNRYADYRFAHMRSVKWSEQTVTKESLRGDIESVLHSDYKISRINDESVISTVEHVLKPCADLDPHAYEVVEGVGCDYIFKSNHKTDDAITHSMNKNNHALSDAFCADTQGDVKVDMYKTVAQAKYSEQNESMKELANEQAERPMSFHHSIRFCKKQSDAYSGAQYMSPMANHRASMSREEQDALPQTLEERVSQKLSSLVSTKEINLQQLLQDLFVAKGFKTRRCVESTERSATLLALSPKNLRVIVQIKNSARPLTEPMLDLAKDVMTIYGSKHSVLVSLAGFTQKTEEAAKLNSTQLKLWTGHDIAKELIAHYGEMNPHVRDCFSELLAA